MTGAVRVANHPVSMVSLDPQDHHDHPARDADALASCGLSSVLALEVPESPRHAANWWGIAGVPSEEPHIACAANEYDHRQ